MQNQSDLVLEELKKFLDHTSYTVTEQANIMWNAMNTEQAEIYDYVAMTTQELGPKSPIFIHGKAGTGKVSLLNAICLLIRGRQQIVLPYATTPLAARLYPGGRPIHSLFQITTNDTVAAYPMIDVTLDSAVLLKESQVIIWDDSPVTNKAIKKSVDHLLQGICNNSHGFGGKCFIALGDLKQVSCIAHVAEFNKSFLEYV